MADPVIEFDHVYKKFARGEQHNSLRDFIPAMAKKLWPFGRRQTAEEVALRTQEFWAVQDVSFKLHRGESMGIIGPNGSGKSTTLKLLSGIIRPERGSYRVHGRLSALIEVGAGFHPDLTGRENIFLNGSILGMTRKEVASKFNDIVEFAGVEEFIDTPVKRYSSGMAVRLGFAVSAFIEPDVMLVDEVLAVGDTEFRNRCLNRMNKMLRNGVTMILVSHNLSEVRNLCQNCLMLYKGQSMMQGPTIKVIEEYHRIVGDKIKVEQEKLAAAELAGKPEAIVAITSAELLNAAGEHCEVFGTGDRQTVRIHFHARKRIERPQFHVELLWATEDYVAAACSTIARKVVLDPIEGRGYVDLKVRSLLVEPNVYAWSITVSDGDNGQPLDTLKKVRFLVNEQEPIPGVFGLAHEWSQPVPEGDPDPINVPSPDPSPAVAGVQTTGVASRSDARDRAA
jgi:ABC-type polysaccharide/polyol phosphate transport system ATPase subunit